MLHAVTVFVSALLLFLIQPLMGKVLLPRYGGTAGVWTAAMLFFQVALLLGYIYSHLLSTYVGRPTRIVVHIGLLAASVLPLPVIVTGSGSTGGSPVAQVLAVLAASVGVPCFLLASTSPLVQAWSAVEKPRPAVYRLYAVSNLASLAALLLYPVIVEPWLSTQKQLRAWSWGYGAFCALCAASALRSSSKRAVATQLDAPAWPQRLLWIALAACPCVMWLSAATALSQNLAPVPMLWILPLSIYLFTLVLCFEREDWYRPALMRWLLPISWLVIAYGVLRPAPAAGVKLQIALFASALFVCCLFCHGELARLKPRPEGLTGYYVTVALGGALGGAFVAVLAPAIFDRFLELPVAVAACVLLAMPMLYGFGARRVLRLALFAGAALAIGAQLSDRQDGTRLRRRNFYGSLQVADVGANGELRLLTSGIVRHGAQFRDGIAGRQGTAYYGANSGVARAMNALSGRPVRAALVGLGAGTLAVYARPGDRYRFYELDPAMIEVANSEFRYLAEARGNVEVIESDGRLGLARDAAGEYDLIVLDAFSGDSIPVHLLTREAFAIYSSRLRTDGVLAVHITNRYADLEGVIRADAAAIGKHALLIESAGDQAAATLPAQWAILTSNMDVIRVLQPAAREPHGAPLFWTDDFSNLLSVLR